VRREHFEQIQASEALPFLRGLLAECRQRYLDAARLLDDPGFVRLALHGLTKQARRSGHGGCFFVMIDADLAQLYGVPTKRLNEQVRRNSDRFADFFFQLTAVERSEVVANCDHLARLKFSPTLPYAFTEHGALMAASVLNTARAVEVGRYVHPKEK
jgi:hypothetical protein